MPMPDDAEMAALVNDPERLGAHVAAALLRRMQDGEVLQWVLEPLRPEDANLFAAGIKTLRFFLDVGNSVVSLRILDLKGVTNPEVIKQLPGVPVASLRVDRDGDTIAFTDALSGSKAPVKQLADEIQRTREARRREWRHEFLTEFGG